MVRSRREFHAGLLAQSALYVLGGVNHFWHEDFYRNIMPDHYAHPDALVKLSGIAEILGGVGLLVPGTRRFAAGGITAMLAVFLDVHVFMLRHPERFSDIPRWVLWARIPMQFALMGWALRYARKNAGRERSV